MEMHAEHIEDLAEGYALGALEPIERTRVEEHVAVCPPCKQHVNGIADTAHMIALVVPPVAPPLSCKRKLMEKVAREQFLATPTRPSRVARAVSMWAAVATIAFVMTGAWAMSLRSERSAMESQLAYYASLGDIMANNGVVRQMQGEVETRPAKAETYMRPGHKEATLVVHNLPAPPSGKTYQVWVAREGLQQPLTTFVPAKSTWAITISPPEPMDKYKWIMVTVEDAGGAQLPSKSTVLFGDL